ncbi:MAG TPA: DUF177 domain-containing protein [Candidatus Sulfotelmatobacter sp.]|nr:DUF177 domain-containing protein [Candidatus Sulfotelmatobacter sp.]
MLSYNVAGLLRSTPGTVRTYPIHLPTLEIAPDLRLTAPIEGELRLSRTGRSILARARLVTALAETCSRCLTPLSATVAVEVDEEALPSVDLLTGAPLDVADEPDALRLDAHHELDLSEPVREAISLAEPIHPLCRPDCRGLCATCGADLNADPAHHHDDADLDPRLAALATWQPADVPD